MALDARGDEPVPRSGERARRYLLVSTILTLVLPGLAIAYLMARETSSVGAAIVELLLVIGFTLLCLLHLIGAGVYLGARHGDGVGWVVAALASLLVLGVVGFGCVLGV